MNARGAHMTAASGWSDERVETLKKLWLDGFSASQVAKQLGGVTRNAVIAKVHRLGLSGRGAPSKPVLKAPRPKPPPTPRPRPSIVAAPAVPAARFVERPEPIRSDGLVSLIDLEHHHCRWPIGDPLSDGFGFCGRRRVGVDEPGADLESYCPTHLGRSVQSQRTTAQKQGDNARAEKARARMARRWAA